MPQQDATGVFAPQMVGQGSPLQDPTLVAELLAFSQDSDQSRRHGEEIHELRKQHASRLFGLTVCWIVVLWGVLMLQGFGKWPLAFCNYVGMAFSLSNTVLVAFMTTTTATVLGLYGIAAYWLYGNGGKLPPKA